LRKSANELVSKTFEILPTANHISGNKHSANQ
jgi:hypothetical protein